MDEKDLRNELVKIGLGFVFNPGLSYEEIIQKIEELKQNDPERYQNINPEVSFESKMEITQTSDRRILGTVDSKGEYYFWILKK